MRHYTYVIWGAETDYFYIGVRSCECAPEDDAYWGSGGKATKQLLKQPLGWAKTVVAEHPTRDEAEAHETALISAHIDNFYCLNVKLYTPLGGYSDRQEVWRKRTNALHLDPEFKAHWNKQQRASKQDPEYRRKMSECMRRRWVEKREAMMARHGHRSESA